MIWLPSSLKSLLAHSPLTKCCTRTWMPLIWMPSSLKSFHAHSPFDPVVARDGERLGALTVKSQRMHVSEEVLGQGSFGRVMAGTLNIGGGRVIKVAVKSLPAMTIPQEREAFQRELKAHIHALRHCDGICKLYGTCERDNRLSLVMKLYEGGSLAKKIRGGPLDADKICRYSSVLRQLHACRLVVHDIKPSNILFDSFDQSVLADFGIAEVVSTATRRLLTSINGTFNYMAPETLDAEAGGPGIGPDVWGMACVVVEMHTGKVPWDGMNIQQIMRVVSVDYRAPAVSETAPAHALLGRCFMRNSEHRPSAGELADACAPPSGAKDLIPELCEEMDRLNAANTMLDARLKATEALLAEEQLEREKLARDKTDLEAQVALVKLEKRQEEALRVLVSTQSTT